MSKVQVLAEAHVQGGSLIYTIDGKPLIGVEGVPLTELGSYARGSIIRGGASDWEAHDAKTNGAVVVGDGTDIASTTTPTYTGLHTFGAGISTQGVRIEKTTRIINTDSPYTVQASDHVIFCDTDGGAITVNLPAGVEGRNLKIINCGSSANDLTVDPNGTEQIFGGGAGVATTVSDGESISIHHNATEGWW